MAERVGTVLVVDDSEFDLRLLAHSVGALGYTVLTAGSAAEAVNRVFDAGSAVDVVLSDIRMEPIDGFGLVDQLQARLPDLPVILVTAQATTDLVIQAVKRRVLDVLVKPVDPAMLASTLATAMRRRELVTTDRTLIETLHRTIDEQTAEIERRLVSHEAEHAELKRVFRQVQEIKAEWERTMDCVSDMVLLIGPDGRLRRCNRAWRDFTGQPYSEILGVSWKELFVRLGLETRTGFAPGCELQHAASGRWFVYREAPFEAVVTTASGSIAPGTSGKVITLNDTTELKLAVRQREVAFEQLKSSQAQVIQSEKLATIGQMTAGVAHEINNPVGFVSSNLSSLSKYLERLAGFIAAVTLLLDRARPGVRDEVQELRRKFKVDFILGDVSKLIAESLDGTARVSKIVKDLGTFSRVDGDDWRPVDLAASLEQAVGIVWNQLKYKATLKREFGALPPVVCNAQLINQVVMNLLVNASHAMDTPGVITLSTRLEGPDAVITVADTGKGIAPAHVTRIFDPFFTTKEAGKGTGLGLSISADIIKKHGGDIRVESEVGVGTTFTIRIPVAGASG